MRPIKMVDLEGQYQKIKSEIDNSIFEVLNKTDFINGEKVQFFADQLAGYLGCNHVVTCANGTDAIQITLMALDIPRGSEVIVPSFCYVAAAEAVALLGLVPVFADVDENTFNVDANSVEPLITEKTRAIIAVHLFGQSCDMLPLLKLAQKYNLFVIEDNAQSIGATYTLPDESKKMTGTIGHVGTTSFFPSKNLGCMGDGGAISVNDEQLAKKMKTIANHGQPTKYMHDEIGINSRLDTLQAAVLSVKLIYLNNYINKRQINASLYDKYFSKLDIIETPYRFEKSTHVFHQYTLRIKNGKRDLLKEYLHKLSIPSMVYYPLPLHKQNAYKQFYKNQNLDISERLSTEVISLPMHTELDEEQIGFISQKIIDFLAP